MRLVAVVVHHQEIPRWLETEVQVAALLMLR
jgi:hypothetical protein